ncbi:MAG: PqqD family protein [Myxococcales bacterium]|nr:MAG: PqqD family protein [Myxococcales bacterium]
MKFPLRNPRVATRTIDGQAVAVSPDDAMLHTFNEIGTLIWELADGKTSLDAIAREVADRYEIGLAQATADVASFCEELVERGILELGDRALG